jgi:GTP cyclohydrolase IV
VDAPAVRPALSRVGLAGVEAVIRLGVDERSARPFAARIDCLVEPDPTAPTQDPERAEEIVAGVIREVTVGAPGMRAERLVRAIAERVRDRAGARRAHVSLDARFPERRPAPVSGIATQEISTLHAAAVASPRGTRRTVGVSAQGITTAPYAQAVLVASAKRRLAADGFADDRIARALDAVPVATHDQRAYGTLHVGCPADCAFEFDVAALLAIVEDAMSSEIFELMKRSDEGAVVERAHRRPRTAADCVAAMVAGVVQRLGHLPDEAFVAARQDNDETVHRHHVTAERTGLLGDLRRELDGGARDSDGPTLRDWLAQA